MQEIASNGQDLPAETEGIDSDLYYTVRSRALSWHGREFYNPDYGMDLITPDEGLIGRVRTSLGQIPGYRLRPSIRTTEQATTLVIDTGLVKIEVSVPAVG